MFGHLLFIMANDRQSASVSAYDCLEGEITRRFNAFYDIIALLAYTLLVKI